ncbi:endonuclease III [Dolosigranulum pigrum]|uniref:Endonuclease III n=1 Tax=Dolosigranulum pigrum TaxID=29394 RepID=A0A328K2P1_9LACT|nr:endonuclease III [Dolosigranulum pigrum]QTJ43032.1 endonuclease III [Dolosigranulum pigrum]QTJ46435.1 endonuclease III [Dolosigranulum pigrum]QTJ51553.1 endonuclease III [Dolosigranulum pigrum]RAN51292.1 endonuclease III [Dolosigranulum pigrum]RAN62905.1 endonuclease III [Dolosigranulum pigrum]
MTDNLLTSEETTKVIRAMGELYPEAKAELNHDSPFQLLIAVILSAQTTDVGVNKVTPGLFEAYPTPEALMQADREDIMEKIKTIGLYRNKAKFIKSCATDIVERFGGEVPQTRKELQSLAGVGRKTANVVMSVAFDEPAIAVDTHVNRISKKFNIAPEDASIRQVENCLMEKLPEDLWSQAHHWLIFFGRYQCPARDHDHEECVRKVYDIVDSM